jgi:NAD(P)-dependent dehydrogenase (short-subunit alcohol dehydrogenase family)
MRLSGKVCIITGTGGSIAREAARTFAREGALVVGCDLTVDAAQATVDMVRAAGGTMVSLHPCHLTKPADCQALVNFALDTFGRIDVLFNNAAMAYFNWIEDITDEEWDRDRREEVDLVFYLTRAAWPHLKTSHGVIVNTGSLNGLLSFKTLPSLAHSTAKAGVIATQDGIAYVPFFPLGGGFSQLQSSTLSDLTRRLRAPPAQIAIAWLLRRAPNILLIAGTSSVVHLRENLTAATLRLPDDALAALNELR